MYLKSIIVKVKELELEFSYPKIISKNEIEYMAMLNKNMQNNQNICDAEGRIILRKYSLRNDNGRNFRIKPIACRDANQNYTFFINIYEQIDTEMKFITKIECPLTVENKKIINETFVQCINEVKQKIKSVKKSEIIFWAGGYEDFDENLCKESIFCYPKEVFDNKSKECWQIESFVDADYLEKLLESAIKQEYGFSNMFKMLDCGFMNVIKSSKFNLNINEIMKKLHSINDYSTSFILESVVMPK